MNKYTTNIFYTIKLNIICLYSAIVWRSIRQSCIVDSTMKIEYVAACEIDKKVIWLKKFMIELEVVFSISQVISLYCDNSGVVANAKEPHNLI
jgi:hypothetical protein